MEVDESDYKDKVKEEKKDPSTEQTDKTTDKDKDRDKEKQESETKSEEPKDNNTKVKTENDGSPEKMEVDKDVTVKEEAGTDEKGEEPTVNGEVSTEDESDLMDVRFFPLNKVRPLWHRVATVRETLLENFFFPGQGTFWMARESSKVREFENTCKWLIGLQKLYLFCSRGKNVLSS